LCARRLVHVLEDAQSIKGLIDLLSSSPSFVNTRVITYKISPDLIYSGRIVCFLLFPLLFDPFLYADLFHFLKSFYLCIRESFPLPPILFTGKIRTLVTEIVGLSNAAFTNCTTTLATATFAVERASVFRKYLKAFDGFFTISTFAINCAGNPYMVLNLVK
jgi:hypothetical protein